MGDPAADVTLIHDGRPSSAADTGRGYGGDHTLAVDLVEQDETNLLEHSKMTSLLEIVKKLPPQLLVSGARLQLAIAWANVLLQRTASANAVLNRFESPAAHSHRAFLPTSWAARLSRHLLHDSTCSTGINEPVSWQGPLALVSVMPAAAF